MQRETDISIAHALAVARFRQAVAEGRMLDDARIGMICNFSPSYTKEEAELFDLYRNQDLHVKPKQLEERGGAHYSDAACSVIDSIYNDRGDIQYVDVRNNGAVSNLPAESAIECAAVITADGPTAL